MDCRSCKYGMELVQQEDGKWLCYERAARAGAAAGATGIISSRGIHYACWTPIENEAINHPQHYTSHPSGIECIDVAEHYDFCLGNAIKYIWRAGLKEDKALEDLRKAKWYLERKIKRLEDAGNGGE